MPVQPLERIRSISSLARYVIVAIGLGVVALAASLLWMAVFAPGRFDEFAAHSLASVDTYAVTAPVRFMLILALGVGFALLGWLLVALARAFARFRAGEVFTPQTCRMVRNAGIAGLFNALYLLVMPTVTVLLLTMNNPPGQRMLAVGLSSHQLFSLMMAIFLLVVGHVLALGTALDEDSRSIV